MKIEKILVPTDFSAISDSALSVAVDFAKRHRASIYLVHILSHHFDKGGGSFTPLSGTIPGAGVSTSGNTYNPYLAAQKKEVEKKLQDLHSKYDNHGVEINLRMYEGQTTNFLTEYIEENAIDIVIMGSLGNVSFIKSLFSSGSHAQKMVRQSLAPVLVIKDPTMKQFSPKNIVFASSFDEEEPAVTDAVKQLQSAFGAKLHLLYISTRNDFHPTHKIRGLIKSFAQKHALENYTENIYNDYSIEEGIIHFTEEHSVDTILLGTHGRQGISRFFFHSVAEALVDYSMATLMTFRI